MEAFSPGISDYYPKVPDSNSLTVHYGVEMGQVAQVFFCDRNRYNTTRLDTLQGNFLIKCHLGGFKPLDKIQISLSYLGNSWDKLTS